MTRRMYEIKLNFSVKAMEVYCETKEKFYLERIVHMSYVLVFL